MRIQRLIYKTAQRNPKRQRGDPLTSSSNPVQ